MSITKYDTANDAFKTHFGTNTKSYRQNGEKKHKIFMNFYLLNNI